MEGDKSFLSENLDVDEESLQALEDGAAILAWERNALQKQLDVLVQQIEQDEQLLEQPEAADETELSNDEAMIPPGSDGLWHTEHHLPLHMQPRAVTPCEQSSDGYVAKSGVSPPMTLGQARSLHKRNVAAEERSLEFSEQILYKLCHLEQHGQRTRWSGQRVA